MKIPKLITQKKIRLILTLAIIIASFFVQSKNPKDETSNQNNEALTNTPSLNKVRGTSNNNPETDGSYFKVTRVIDGDTIELETGQKVRYIGIDTPEISGGIQCFAKEARSKNTELVLGKQIKLEKDVSETDRFGRLLRYAYIGDNFVNEILVSQGFAYSSSYPPDIKYQDKLRQAENSARENNLGLWMRCRN